MARLLGDSWLSFLSLQSHAFADRDEHLHPQDQVSCGSRSSSNLREVAKIASPPPFPCSSRGAGTPDVHTYSPAVQKDSLSALPAAWSRAAPGELGVCILQSSGLHYRENAVPLQEALVQPWPQMPAVHLPGAPTPPPLLLDSEIICKAEHKGAWDLPGPPCDISVPGAPF